MSFAGVGFSFARQFLWAKCSLEGARRLHDDLLWVILRAPMSFFHRTPTGRIINRFSRDQDKIDTVLPDNLSDVALAIVSAISLIISICVLLPWFLLACVPAFLLYRNYVRKFRSTARELGRLDSISRSPIFAQYSEVIQGMVISAGVRNGGGIALALF
jgi:ATP-binding cassette subfamily C (CFTR/MRP) protein 1